MLASRGLRDMDDGAKPIADEKERETVRRQARTVHTRAFVFAAIVTAIVVAAPGLD